MSADFLMSFILSDVLKIGKVDSTSDSKKSLNYVDLNVLSFAYWLSMVVLLQMKNLRDKQSINIATLVEMGTVCQNISNMISPIHSFSFYITDVFMELL